MINTSMARHARSWHDVAVMRALDREGRLKAVLVRK